MTIAKEHNTAKIRNDLFCRKCGWPIVDACCNDEFTKFKDASIWDWWYYCSNKGCTNHDGEGVFQGSPDWVFRVEKPKSVSLIKEEFEYDDSCPKCDCQLEAQMAGGVKCTNPTCDYWFCF